MGELRKDLEVGFDGVLSSDKVERLGRGKALKLLDTRLWMQWKDRCNFSEKDQTMYEFVKNVLFLWKCDWFDSSLETGFFMIGHKSLNAQLVDYVLYDLQDLVVMGI